MPRRLVTPRPLEIGCCEDDRSLIRVLDQALAQAGHRGSFVTTGTQALAKFSKDARLDVLVLDIGLPDIDGRDLCRALRQAGQHAPVLFLSGRHDVQDIVDGFAAGGLDYLLKPFSVIELIARIEALARPIPSCNHTGVRVDPHQQTISLDGNSRTLSPTEFRIATELLANTGRLVTRSALINTAWVPGAHVNTNTLDTYIHRLRQHLHAIGSTSTIRTTRATGFTLEEPSKAPRKRKRPGKSG